MAKPLVKEQQALDNILELRRQGLLDEAQDATTAALASFPKSVLLLIEQGHLYADQKLHELALEAYEQALSSDPSNPDALLSKWRSLSALRNFTEAESLSPTILQLFPKDVHFLVERGRVFVDQREYVKGIESFDQALAVDPDNADALYYKAQGLRLNRDFPQAEAVLVAARQRLPNDPDFLYEKAHLFLDQRQYPKSIEMFDQILARDPGSIRAWRDKIRCLRLKEDFSQAEAVISSAVDRFPGETTILNEKGRLFLDQQNYDKAVESFDKTLSIDPDNADALYYKAQALRLKRDFSQSEAVLAAALQRLSKDVDLLGEKGRLLLDLKQYDKAIEIFDEVLAIQPNNTSALYYKVRSLRLKPDLPQAETFLASAMQRFPNDPDLLREKGRLFHNRGQYEQAISAFDRVLALDPDNVNALFWKADALRLKRDFSGAEKLLSSSLARFPKNPDFLNEFGWLYYDQKDYAKAIDAFDRTLAIQPDNSEALYWKADSLRILRKFPQAQEALSLALHQLPKDVDFLIGKGRLLYDQQQYDKAIDSFTQALAAQPDHVDALFWKARCLRWRRKFDETEKLFSSLSESLSSDIDLILERGRLEFDQGKLEEAENIFAQAQELYPESSSALSGRVDSLKRMYRTQEAEELLTSFKVRFEDSLDADISLGWLRISQYKLSEAKSIFQAILQKDPRHGGALNGLGAAYMEDSLFEEADAKFREALDTDVNEPVFHTNLAYALIEQAGAMPASPAPEHQEYEWLKFWKRETKHVAERYLQDAEDHFKTAIKLDSESANAYGGRGVVAFKRGRILESEDFLCRSVRVSPTDGLYVDLGALYAFMGRYEEAEAQFQKALQLDKNNWRAIFELGNLYLKLDDSHKASRFFLQAMNLNPGSSDPPRALANCLMRAGRFNEAESILRKALRQLDSRKRWELHLALAQLFTEMGDNKDDSSLYDDALKELCTAINLNPKHPDSYYQMGRVKFKLGEFQGALKSFRHCLRRDKNHFDAERDARAVQSFIKREKKRTTSSMKAGVFMSMVCLSLLMLLWVLYLRPATSSKVSPTMLLTLSPLLLALSIIAFLMPWLKSLKLAGMEAELTPQTETLSKGPSGVSSIGSAASTPTFTGPSGR